MFIMNRYEYFFEISKDLVTIRSIFNYAMVFDFEKYFKFIIRSD
jgi:hypothetical protein